MRTLTVLALLAACAAPAGAQQLPDTTFDVRVERPAHPPPGPRVRIDEAHHNFHTTTGRYRAFAGLIAADGCRVTPGKAAFTDSALAGCDLLVISNALGAERMDDSLAARSAFTPRECDAVRDWVAAGGALLLIADHAPMGAAAADLAARFGVEMRNGATLDPGPEGTSPTPALIDFAPGTGLGDHAILRGRDSTERVRVVRTFTGQSMRGPAGAVSLLTLSPSAVDMIVASLAELATAGPDRSLPAAGRSQGLAFPHGKGRVVVLGEAAMLSAQVAGPRRTPIGMNAPGNDNRRFALNVVRWLTGVE